MRREAVMKAFRELAQRLRGTRGLELLALLLLFGIAGVAIIHILNPLLYSHSRPASKSVCKRLKIRRYQIPD